MQSFIVITSGILVWFFAFTVERQPVEEEIVSPRLISIAQIICEDEYSHKLISNRIEIDACMIGSK